MQTDEIVRLTRKRVAAIIAARRERQESLTPPPGPERRKSPRWPFKGAVELWPHGGDGSVCWHAAYQNLSETGVGLSTEVHFDQGTTLDIAMHLPEMSLCGQAVVRYCAPVRDHFMVGLEFIL